MGRDEADLRGIVSGISNWRNMRLPITQNISLMSLNENCERTVKSEVADGALSDYIVICGKIVPLLRTEFQAVSTLELPNHGPA
jgi:hypothetical protein